MKAIVFMWVGLFSTVSFGQCKLSTDDFELLKVGISKDLEVQLISNLKENKIQISKEDSNISIIRSLSFNGGTKFIEVIISAPYNQEFKLRSEDDYLKEEKIESINSLFTKLTITAFNQLSC